MCIRGCCAIVVSVSDVQPRMHGTVLIRLQQQKKERPSASNMCPITRTTFIFSSSSDGRDVATTVETVHNTYGVSGGDESSDIENQQS